MKIVTFKLKEELYKELEKIADQNSLTISAQIRLILIDYIVKLKEKRDN